MKSGAKSGREFTITNKTTVRDPGQLIVIIINNNNNYNNNNNNNKTTIITITMTITTITK